MALFNDESDRPVLRLLFMPLRDSFDAYSTGFERARGLSILSLLCVGVVTLFVVGCGGAPAADPTPTPTTKKASEETSSANELKKKREAIDNNPTVVTVKEANRRISESLTAIKERLERKKLTAEDKAFTEKNMLAAVELLLPLAESAREDVDALIRLLEDVRFEQQYVQKSLRDAAALFRARGEHAKTDEVRSIEERISEWLELLADDVPRRQKLTDGFLNDLRDTRTRMAEAVRGLRDLKAAYTIILPDNPDALKTSPEGQTFYHRLQEFMQAVQKYHAAFFAGDAYRGTGEKK